MSLDRMLNQSGESNQGVQNRIRLRTIPRSNQKQQVSQAYKNMQNAIPVSRAIDAHPPDMLN